MTTPVHRQHNELLWQHRGRCLQCQRKLAGCRRIRRCVCGGEVAY